MHELRMRKLPPGKESSAPPAENTTCENQAIAFLVDVSGSMLDKDASGVSKIEKLRKALKEFTVGLSDDAAIAIYSFSEPFNGIPGDGFDPKTGLNEHTLTEPDIPEPVQRLPMMRYGAVLDTYNGIVDNLIPYPFAATYMREGFTWANVWLNDAKADFPDYKRNLVFISDGVPETDVRGPNDIKLAENRSYSPDQDPTKSPNLGDQIKANGVSIYSVMLYTQVESNNPQLFTIFSGILKNVATQPSKPYYYESLNADNIEEILTDIRSQACSK